MKKIELTTTNVGKTIVQIKRKFGKVDVYWSSGNFMFLKEFVIVNGVYSKKYVRKH